MSRVLLDENMAHKLLRALDGFNPTMVQHMGWSGLTNGELLRAAEAAGFTVLLTGDKTVEFEQNMRGRKIAVVALSAPHWPIIRNHLDKIAAVVGTAVPGTVTRLDVGRFVRRRSPPALEP